jgi:RNA polymerase sigma-70 factor (ECF subfamily)
MRENTPKDGAGSETRFFRLWTRNEPQLRAYVRVCCPKPEEVDEIMQECAIVAWQKFETQGDEEKFERWVCAIARYQVLQARRRHARNRLVLSEEVLELLADESAEELSLRSRQMEALEGCMAKLPRERRDLALVAYAKRAAVQTLALQLKRSEGAIYQLLARIRQDLLGCMEKALAAGETR